MDWNVILRGGGDQLRYLSVRGRNILFAQRIFEALQIDNERDLPLDKYKAAFTSSAVKRIYEAILEIWPPNTDIEWVLTHSRSDVAGLYVGDYDGFFVRRAVVRHSLYASKILLIDPFVHPYSVTDEYNPTLNPEKYRAQTLKNVNLFLSLLPWIDAGLVEFIRTPADFVRGMAWEMAMRSKKLRADPTLAESIRRSVQQIKDRHFERITQHNHLLTAPDEYILSTIKEAGLAESAGEQQRFLDYLQRLRDGDPDFLERVQPGKKYAQLSIMSTGGPIEAARLAAQLSGAYLFTDIDLRWQLIKRDREHHSAEEREWSPFSKAIHDAKLTYLNNIKIDQALRVRQEGRLAGVRAVLREAWLRERDGDDYDDVNTIRFVENLTSAISAAEAEWSEMRGDLVKHGMIEGAAGLLAAGPLIAAGQGFWLAGALAAATAGTSAYSHFRHQAFLRRFPAAFFMDLKDAE